MEPRLLKRLGYGYAIDGSPKSCFHTALRTGPSPSILVYPADSCNEHKQATAAIIPILDLGANNSGRRTKACTQRHPGRLVGQASSGALQLRAHPTVRTLRQSQLSTTGTREGADPTRKIHDPSWTPRIHAAGAIYESIHANLRGIRHCTKRVLGLLRTPPHALLTPHSTASALCPECATR